MTSKKTERLVSLDALRGFDMFWIAGGAMMIHALNTQYDSSLLNWLYVQTEHAPWHGFRFFDLIFPLFLFIAGVSFPFSLEKRRRTGHSEKSIYRHVIQRGLVLVLLGIIYNGLLQLDFENIRIASVLGRIGLAWMFAALITMNAGIRWQAVFCVFILLSYWAILMLVPVPGYGPGDLSMEGSVVGYVDRL
jgi:predicted acyltransferase